MTKRILGIAVLVAMLAGFAGGRALAQDEAARAKPPETKIYNVRDLVTPVRDFETVEFETQVVHPGEGPTPEGTVIGEDPRADEIKSPDELLNELIDLIRQVIEAGTWEDGSGNAIRGRAGVIIVTHQAQTQAKVQMLLDDLRKTEGRMVSVRVRFVVPKRPDVERIWLEKRSLASTPAEKTELLKLAGDPLQEVRFVATDRQKIPVATTETAQIASKAEGEVRVDTTTGGITGWTRPTVFPDGSVRLDLSVTMAKVSGKGTPITQPPTASLTVRGSYVIPDGGALFASGATLAGEDGNKEVYALIEVQVIPLAKAK